jgi:molecular chaperone HtpG
MQDSALVHKLNRVITNRFLRFLEKEAEADPARYESFYGKFQRFLKEGTATDFEHRGELAKLLRFESSLLEPGELTGLAGYVSRSAEGSDTIYYLLGTSRRTIEAGPYLEAFRARGIEVLYFCDPVDEYVAGSLGEFDGRKLKAGDSPDLDLGKFEAEGEPLAADAADGLCRWMQERCGERVARVRAGDRLTGSPAAAFVEHGAMGVHLRRMMREMGGEGSAEKVILEINTRHPLIRTLAGARERDPEGAELAALQLLDNALLSAGLMEEPQEMVQRIHALIARALAPGPQGSIAERP